MSIQRYDLVCEYEANIGPLDDGDYVAYADHLAALTAERERADKAEKARLVPGEMRCAKCNFGLIRTNLYIRNGTTGPGGNATEPCPNGCGPLWPETWEHSARVAWERLETMHFELVAERERADRAEAERDALQAEVELWKERAYQLSHA